MLLVFLFALLAVDSARSQGPTSAPFVSGAVMCTPVAVQFDVDPKNANFEKIYNYTGDVGVFADNGYPNCSVAPVTVITELSPNYAISIPFSACGIPIVGLYGAQQTLLEYSATILARLSPLDYYGGANFTWNPNYPNISFTITCNWLTGAQISSNFNVTNNNPQPPPPVGNTTSPVNDMNMTLTDENGNIISQVEAGTRIRVLIKLNGDSFYKSELPEYCMVSNGPLGSPGTYIVVIANFCPYQDTIMNSPFNFKAYQQDSYTYFFDFDAFVYNNQPTTLYISCYVQVCLNVTDCKRDCWPQKNAAEKFVAAISSNTRHRRSLIQFDSNQPPIANTTRSGSFKVIPKNNAVSTSTPASSSGSSGLPDWALILIILFCGFLLFSLLLCFCCCVCCGVGLGLWTRRREKYRDHHTEYIYPQPAPMAPTTAATDGPSIYHMEIPKVNLSSSSSARSIISDKSYKY